MALTDEQKKKMRSPGYIDANGKPTGVSIIDDADGEADDAWYQQMTQQLNPALFDGVKTKGGAGSGNFGHAGRPGKVGGSASNDNPQAGVHVTDIGKPAPRMRPIKKRGAAARHMREQAIKNGGFTYQPLLASSPKKGMALSIYPDRETIVRPIDLSLETMKKFIDENLDLLADPLNHVGGWLNPEDGLVYLDVSRVVNSRKEATRLCHQYQQYGYFDLAAGEYIEVSGAREKNKNRKENRQWVRFELPNSPSDAELTEAVKKLREAAGLDKDEDKGEDKPED